VLAKCSNENMTQIAHEGPPRDHSTEEDDLIVDPWSVKFSEARDYVRHHRRVAIASTLALALGIGGGILLGRSGGSDEAVAGPGNGVAAGPAVPGNNNVDPNIAPTPSSGGFNNAAKVVLQCTGLDIRLEPGTTDTYSVTPKVDVSSGDVNSPYVYTLLGTDLGHNEVAQGVGTIHGVKRGDNVEFPVVLVVDTAGTEYSPNDPDALKDPFGDSIPDQQLFDCPVVPYPAH
jgi:hypothetical protein